MTSLAWQFKKVPCEILTCATYWCGLIAGARRPRKGCGRVGKGPFFAWYFMWFYCWVKMSEKKGLWWCWEIDFFFYFRLFFLLLTDLFSFSSVYHFTNLNPLLSNSIFTTIKNGDYTLSRIFSFSFGFI